MDRQIIIEILKEFWAELHDPYPHPDHGEDIDSYLNKWLAKLEEERRKDTKEIFKEHKDLNKE